MGEREEGNVGRSSNGGRESTAAASRRARQAAAWKAPLTILALSALVYGCVSGLAVWLLPFSPFNQLNILVHTAVGVLTLPLLVFYSWRHWQSRRRGNFNHYQLLGYIATGLLALCLLSGLVVTLQGALGSYTGSLWRSVHLYSGIAFTLFLLVHVGVIVWDRRPKADEALRMARRRFYSGIAAGCAALLVVTGLWTVHYSDPSLRGPFVEGYDWRFGTDQPFLPSLARLDDSELREEVRAQVLKMLSEDERERFLPVFERLETEVGSHLYASLDRLDRSARNQLEEVKRRVGVMSLADQIRRSSAALNLDPTRKDRVEEILAEAEQEVHRSFAVDPRALGRSAQCGSCHQEIYEEWLPSAHRYSSLDVFFQAIQELTALEVSPAHTRYCAGCHDPISLFAGAKNPHDITLSSEGFDEGISCVVCHSIVQADVRGNADYVLELQPRYVYELHDGKVPKFLSDFLIRTYPEQHVRAFSRRLYRTPEYCGVCHKQFMDEMINRDIGMVLAQNQYDNWKGSHWNRPDDPQRSVTCRECHMPLTASSDPSAGDIFNHDYNRTPNDGKHRNHRFLGANQIIPVLQGLEGGREQVRLTEAWLRGEIEIPEISDKWTEGPAVTLEILTPRRVLPGNPVIVQVVVTNVKAGHDFPTGPLDVIQSWVELKVEDAEGRLIYHRGTLDDEDLLEDPLISYHSEPYDRQGRRLWRHELWNLVGSRYRRALFPGQSDVAAVELPFPADSVTDRRGELLREASFELDVPDEIRGRLSVTAVLWYRKANPRIVDLLLSPESGLRVPREILGEDVDLSNLRIPITEVTRTGVILQVDRDGYVNTSTH